MTHAEAAEILSRAWRQVHGRSPSASELLYAQAIALLETGYGRAGQFGRLADQGMFNWGALERRRLPDGSCPTGTAPGTDQGSVCFYVFPDDVQAATAFVRNLTKRHWPVLEAMRGTAEDVARAMRVAPPYYAGTAATEAGKIAQYASAIEGAVKRIGGALPEPRSLLPWLALAAGVGYVGYRRGWWDDALRRARRWM